MEKKDRIKELVKPQQVEGISEKEAEFLCTEHLAGCRRNSGVVEDDDILF